MLTNEQLSELEQSSSVYTDVLHELVREIRRLRKRVEELEARAIRRHRGDNGPVVTWEKPVIADSFAHERKIPWNAPEPPQ